MQAADPAPGAPAGRRLFVSYTAADRAWAEWVAWQLEAAGHQVRLQAWDFQPGANFVEQMNQALGWAERVVAVISDAYFASPYARDEWTAALVRGRGEPDRLLLVRVQPCTVPPLLANRVWVDLVGVDEATAGLRLMAAVAGARAKPTVAPVFPGGGEPGVPPRFPGVGAAISNLPPRNLGFVGRAGLLEVLHQRLAGGESAALVAAYGLGGVGKTQLALEYAHRHAGDYELVWWLTADSALSIVGGLAELAPRVGVAVEPDLEATAAAVIDVLGRRAGWLLVFDNADDPQVVARFLPAGGDGRVLVTSRNPTFGQLGARIPVEVLPTGEAAELLLARTHDPDRAAAVELATELDGLPLALAQAAGYCEQTSLDLGGYLARYRTRRAELLAKATPLGYPDPVTTTWQLNLDQLQHREPAAVELLRLCAFLAPEAIGLELLAAAPEKLPAVLAGVVVDELALDEAIAALYRFSLLRRDRNGLGVHRLVQQVVRDSLDTEQTRVWAGRAVELVLAAMPKEPQDPGGWPRCAVLVAHAQAAAGHARACAAASETTGALLNQVGVYLWSRAELAAARVSLDQALAIKEAAYGTDHPQVARTLGNLGNVLRELGELPDARQQLERALAIFEATYGPDHPEVARTLSNLGNVLGELGESPAARAHLERALAIKEATYGPDHPEVARTLSNLGAVLRQLGELPAARAHLERALAIKEAAYGPDHPEVARTLSDLGIVLDELGELPAARACQERALAILRETLGAQHDHTRHVERLLGELADRDEE
jgi:tetratricopeptide (TPR) repeat protein